MVPPNKAAKTASNVTASNAALPAALAPVQARMAPMPAPVVVSGYKMPVLPVSAELPPSQVINDAHLAAVRDLNIEDIHRDDDQDAQEAKEYVMPALDYMLKIEPEYQPRVNYMELQNGELTWKMRSTLADWLVGIHWQYKWQAETLLLAVNILDRYLSKRIVERSKLQLVGATSMLIACKFEQIYTPYIQEFSFLCEEMYTKQQFIDMERTILVALEFKLGQPSAMTYLRRISKAENYDIATRTIAKYLVESAILSEKFLPYTPSEIAAASILAARRMRSAGPWDVTMEYYSGYTEAQLAPCVDEFAAFLHGNTRYRAVYRKFAGKPFLRASQFVEQHLQKTGGKI